MNIFISSLFGLLAFTTNTAATSNESFSYDPQTPFAGTWTGTVELPGKPAGFGKLTIEINPKGERLVTAVLIANRVKAVTCSDVTVKADKITFVCPVQGSPVQFHGSMSNGAQTFDGNVFEETTGSGTFVMRRAPSQSVWSSAQTFTGKASTGSMSVDMALVVGRTPQGKWVGSVDIPILNLKDFPLQDVQRDGDGFTAAIPIGRHTAIEGTMHDHAKFFGTMTQGPLVFDLDLKYDKHYSFRALPRPQHPKPPFPYRQRDIKATHPNGHVLAGTLTLPQVSKFGPGPYPAAVLITGGGREDRDYTSLGHKPFLVIADHLTRRGIAVMRYDDRGVGESIALAITPLGKDSTSLKNATDTLAVVKRLREIEEIDSSRIGLIGHSEGGAIAPLVYSLDDRIAFVVMLAAPGVRGDHVFRKQFELSWQAEGFDPDTVAKLSSAFAQLAERISTNAPQENIDESIDNLCKLQLANAPSSAESKAQKTQSLKTAYEVFVSPWWRYMFGYDPKSVLSAMKCPVLAVNGKKDVQVWHEQNIPAIASAIRAAGGDVSVRTYEGLNHPLQPAQTGLPNEYANIEITIDERVLRDMFQWLAQKLALAPR